MKVLNFGSLNIDYVYRVKHFAEKGETISSQSLEVFSGGKGMNQSIALARAGAKVCHAGVIGEDGHFLKEILHNAGVDVSHIQVDRDTKTGHAMIQNDEEGDNCIVLYGGANQRITKEYVDEVLEQFSEGDMIILQNEINQMVYIMEQSHKKGMKIVLNPSPMDEKIEKLPLEYVDYFFVNEKEAVYLAGKKSEDEDKVLEDLSKRFPEAAFVMTLGEKGSVYQDKEKKIRQQAMVVEAVDTTAAGDTYTGYFVAGLVRGEEIEVIMEQASKASALAVSRKGAVNSIPEFQEILA